MSRRVVFGGGFTATTALAAALAFAQAPPAFDYLDLDPIFRCQAESVSAAECAEARSLIMFHCNSCHSFVRLVRRQHAPKAWGGIIERMGSLAGLEQQQMDLITRYLAENFHEGLPPPQLPPEFASVP